MYKCRICLEYKKNLCSVFVEDRGISYADMLTSVAKIKIVQDVFKNSICLQCRRKLRNLYDFKKEIERSDLEINKQFRILKFDNIDDVISQLKEGIDVSKANLIMKTDVDYMSILENDNKPMFYKNITITKMNFRNNCMEETNKVIPGLDLEIIDYETDNDYVYFDADFVTHNNKPVRRKNIKTKGKEKNKDGRKTAKHSSHSKKVCIKPIILDNIRIIRTARRKTNKTPKEHKHRKRLDICPHCGITSTNLKSHIMVHTGEKKYKCTECTKAFFTSNLLNYHKSKHLSAGAFKCDHCVAVFNSKSSLQSHMISHTDDKKHVCPICNKSFKRKSALLRHKLIHNSSAKSFKCELCNMSFLYKYGLRHHMRVHTGERPFKCEICSQPYSYKHDFNRHCLKKHGVFLKQRSVHVMNEEVLMQERALMKELMLKVQGVVKDGEPVNPFQGPTAALAFDEAVKALGSCQIPIDVML